jgi:hypothetical protein
MQVSPWRPFARRPTTARAASISSFSAAALALIDDGTIWHKRIVLRGID